MQCDLLRLNILRREDQRRPLSGYNILGITYFFQYIIGSILVPYLEIDPITISILLGAFLSLSKPIGGLIFGFVFWNISRTVSYEKNIKTFMVISGWGVFLIFAPESGNDTSHQSVSSLRTCNGISSEYGCIFYVGRYIQFGNTCFSKY